MPDQTLRLSGLWIPIITPFAQGRLDLASFEKLLDRYLGKPVEGMIVAATTGEGLTLEETEVLALASLAAKTIKGKIPLLLGLSGSNTAKLVHTVGQSALWPVDGYLISCPYYSRPSQSGLLQHFTAIAEATDRPVALYNIPYRTGVNLANETAFALAGIPNIVGLKDCCADPAQTFDLLRRKPDSFSVMTGEDAHYYNALAHGAEGAILASAHVETETFAAVQRRLTAGDQPGALATWGDIADLTSLLFVEPSPAAIKHWLWREGLIASPEVRLPMTSASIGLADRIDDAMRKRGLAIAA